MRAVRASSGSAAIVGTGSSKVGMTGHARGRHGPILLPRWREPGNRQPAHVPAGARDVVGPRADPAAARRPLTRREPGRYSAGVGLDALRRLVGCLGRRAGTRVPPAHLGTGARVRLRAPLGSRDRVFIPAGAVGIVLGPDGSGRRASVELDVPRTVVTVPWAWLEALPGPVAEPESPADARHDRGRRR